VKIALLHSRDVNWTDSKIFQIKTSRQLVFSHSRTLGHVQRVVGIFIEKPPLSSEDGPSVVSRRDGVVPCTDAEETSQAAL